MTGHIGEDLVNNRYVSNASSPVENVSYYKSEIARFSCQEVEKEVRPHLVGGFISCPVPKMVSRAGVIKGTSVSDRG